MQKLFSPQIYVRQYQTEKNLSTSYNISRTVKHYFLYMENDNDNYEIELVPILMDKSINIFFYNNSKTLQSFKSEDKTIANFTLKLSLSKLHSKVLHYELLSGLQEKKEARNQENFEQLPLAKSILAKKDSKLSIN